MSIHMNIILYLLCACLASLCCLGVTLELSLEFTSQCDFLNAPNIPQLSAASFSAMAVVEFILWLTGVR